MTDKPHINIEFKISGFAQAASYFNNLAQMSENLKKEVERYLQKEADRQMKQIKRTKRCQ